jgi:hypothetical protein
MAARKREQGEQPRADHERHERRVHQRDPRPQAEHRLERHELRARARDEIPQRLVEERQPGEQAHEVETGEGDHPQRDHPRDSDAPDAAGARQSEGEQRQSHAERALRAERAERARPRHADDNRFGEGRLEDLAGDPAR